MNSIRMWSSDAWILRFHPCGHIGAIVAPYHLFQANLMKILQHLTELFIRGWFGRDLSVVI